MAARLGIVKLIGILVFILAAFFPVTAISSEFGGGGSGGGGAGESWCQPDYRVGTLYFQVADGQNVVYAGVGEDGGMFWDGSYGYNSEEHGVPEPTGQISHGEADQSRFYIPTKAGVYYLTRFRYRLPRKWWNSAITTGDSVNLRKYDWIPWNSIVKGDCPPDDPNGEGDPPGGGDPGSDGDPGQDGDDGDDGNDGDNGDDGDPGGDGNDGNDGDPGGQGDPGGDGNDGNDGDPGGQGDPGGDGDDGDDGGDGGDGSPGQDGNDGNPGGSPLPSPSPSPEPPPKFPDFDIKLPDKTCEDCPEDNFTDENFFEFALEKFKDKFPFDIFGDIKSSGKICPKVEFYNASKELCQIPESLAKLKVPIWIIWGLKLVVNA